MPRISVRPISRPKKVNSSISETPVMMSGLVSGMFVTVLTAFLSLPAFMRKMP